MVTINLAAPRRFKRRGRITHVQYEALLDWMKAVGAAFNYQKEN